MATVVYIINENSRSHSFKMRFKTYSSHYMVTVVQNAVSESQSTIHSPVVQKVMQLAVLIRYEMVWQYTL